MSNFGFASPIIANEIIEWKARKNTKIHALVPFAADGFMWAGGLRGAAGCPPLYSVQPENAKHLIEMMILQSREIRFGGKHGELFICGDSRVT